MKKLFTIAKTYRIFFFLAVVFFPGIQARVIAQDIDFNSTSCNGGIVSGNTLFNQIGTINGIACPGLTIQSIKLVSLIDVVNDNPNVICVNEATCSSGGTIIGIHFTGSGATSSSYKLTGVVSADGNDHQIIFKLKATQSDGKTQQQSYRMHVTSTGAWGDPHLTTVDSVGVHYDFQSVGEFVLLKAGNADNFEIQARQVAVATSGPGSASTNTTGLSTCVSVFSAVAARVGTHRVTYQPKRIQNAEPNDMQLRVDGKVIELDERGIDLGTGGRVMRSPAGAGVIQIDFPNGASLLVTPHYWSAHQKWYLDLLVSNTLATQGLLGTIPPGSWLPALPDGSSLGPKSDTAHVRFVTLYVTFADAWRITDASSLFDYANGDSTKTFTDRNWPVEHAQSCDVKDETTQTPIPRVVAEQLCKDIVDPNMREDAIFDVMVTGDSVFAKSYLLTQRVMMGTTAVRVTVNKDTTKYKEPVIITALVSRLVLRKFAANAPALTGSVEFTADDKTLGQVKLDASGSATLTTSSLEAGQHQVAARFIPDSDSTVFSSSSPDVTHVVTGGGDNVLHQWWFWLLILLIIIAIIIALRKKKKNP